MSENIDTPQYPATFDTFIEHLRQNGKSPDTQHSTLRALRTMSRDFNVDSPQLAKLWLANAKESNRLKPNTLFRFTSVLNSYYKYMNIVWTKPDYKTEDVIPYIPPETELDLLIGTARPRTATLLQMAKETAARLGELAKIEWQDIDFNRKTVAINHPEKNCLARVLPISDKMILLLSRHPHDRKTLFNPNKTVLRQTFDKLKKRIAKLTGNPNLLKIHMHTFRHWKATMEYHKVRDVYHVKLMLGHRSVTATEKYITIEKYLWMTNADEWTHLVVHSEEEEIKAVSTGFELVRTIQTPYPAIYRKRK